MQPVDAAGGAPSTAPHELDTLVQMALSAHDGASCAASASAAAAPPPPSATVAAGGAGDMASALPGCSMYVYDGVDYRARRKADDEAFERLVGGDADAQSPLHGIIEGGGKRRRHTTAEEAAARRLELEQLHQQAEQNKLERALQRKLDRWRKAGYTSAALPLPSAAASGDAVEDGDDEAQNLPRALRFVMGDALAASTDRRPPDAARFVLVWTDDTGRWPSRGFFSTVSAVSGKPQAVYEAAHAQGDLKLGDAHLVDCTSERPGLWVCMIVVLCRERKAAPGTPPSLSTDALDTALRKVAAAAPMRQATVHSPRLPAAASGNSWYAAERLLRKHLCAIATSVYYFPRRSR